MSFRGESYLWSKHSNFLKVVDLPQRVVQEIELGMEYFAAEKLLSKLLANVGLG